MGKYVKKPVAIEAYQMKEILNKSKSFPTWFTRAFEVRERTIKLIKGEKDLKKTEFLIRTADGKIYASGEDYIVKEANGSIFRYTPQTFNDTYEKVN